MRIRLAAACSMLCLVPIADSASFGQEFGAGGSNWAPVSVAPVGNETSRRVASETEPLDPYLAEVLDRLNSTERRLERMEFEQQTLLQDAMAGAQPTVAPIAAPEKKDKKWYEKYGLRGYAQFRLNEIMAEDAAGASAHHNGDSSVGDDQSFLLRRARLVISGDATDRVSIYFQPDFASTPNGSTDAIHFVQVRDWYADLHLDDAKEFRIRVGQSKVPYGWENLQSSQNRLPLDRNDAFNSATKNERDLGAFFYWTPKEAQDTFKFIMDEGLKGSGNYGVFGFGVYNGQGGSLREQNDDLHVISRLTLPMTFQNGQIVEVGVQAYTGMYSVLGDEISPLGVGPAVQPLGTIDNGGDAGIIDKRIGGTFVYYPQPLGFQAEWTVGRGPGLNDAQTIVTDRHLYGGYLMTMYRYETDCYGEFIPFVRWAHFVGGYKNEKNSPFSHIEELEAGVEWQISKYVEFVSMYTITDRTNTRARGDDDTLSYEQFDGQLLRFQLQVNY